MSQKISFLKTFFKKKLWVIRYLFSIIYFNYHYLPFRQAVFLPIWLYKPNFLNFSGRVMISKRKVYPGMIKLGHRVVTIYPNTGIIWDNKGTIVFEGACQIGNNSAISVGPKGKVSFGENFMATTTLRLVCYYKVKIGTLTTIGWDCIIMDTDQHRITRLDGSQSKGYGSVIIGKECWITNRCTVLKNTILGDKITIASGTTISGNYSDIPEMTVVGFTGNIRMISRGYLDRLNDEIIYE